MRWGRVPFESNGAWCWCQQDDPSLQKEENGMMSTPIRIALVDDHQIVLESLAARLNADPQMQVVCTAKTSDDGLAAVLEAKPDVAIFDVELPGRGVFDIAAEIRSRQRSTRILFLTGYLTDVFIEHALKAKAYGYMMKGESIEILLDGIRRIAAGEQVFSKEVSKRLDYDQIRKRYTMREESPFSNLTSRQLEVLRHLVKGDSVKEIAKSMHLSHKSIDSHKYRIMHKLGIHDRVQLTRYAIREGLTVP
jgi:DNA-binding NarL/FixJ family response regulator